GGPAAGHVDVVQRQLGVAAPGPVDAHGPGRHAAAADGAVVEVELVVAKPELPEPVLAHLRARQAAPVVPGAAARRPHRAGVAAAGVVTGGVDAVAAGEEVLALQLQPSAVPQRLETDGRQAVDVGHRTAVDQALGE